MCPSDHILLAHQMDFLDPPLVSLSTCKHFSTINNIEKEMILWRLIWHIHVYLYIFVNIHFSLPLNSELLENTEYSCDVQETKFDDSHWHGTKEIQMTIEQMIVIQVRSVETEGYLVAVTGQMISKWMTIISSTQLWAPLHSICHHTCMYMETGEMSLSCMGSCVLY